MTACATNDGICLLEFEDRPDIEKQLDSLRSHLNAKLVPATNNHLLNLQLQIDQYFNKDLKIFNLPLVYAGTDFQKRRD